MSVVDDAIQRLQAIALSCTDTEVRHAPDYPIEDATALPLCIAHIVSGSGNAPNATMAHLEFVVSVDVHFARVNIKDAYTRIDKFIPEYLRRLAKDPTLDGSIDTIQLPVKFNVQPAQRDAITTQIVSYDVPIKTLEPPIATST